MTEGKGIYINWESLIGNPEISDLHFLKGVNMEERSIYHPFDAKGKWAAEGCTTNHTFLITLPDNYRREVKAAYMEVDAGSLYFEDDDHDTILAFGPGHWVWAERIKEE